MESVMKFSVDRLKNIDWKQFAVNHGEKIALGVVGLVVLLIVFMGTRWKTFQEKQPDELISQVETEDKALLAAKWPETERAIYTDKYDVNFVYDNTYSVVKADKFRYLPGHPMYWPLHRQQEPIEEPVWYAVEELVQTPGRFIMEIPPPGQEAIVDGALAIAAEEAAQEEEDDPTLAGFKKSTAGQQFGAGAEGGMDPMTSEDYTGAMENFGGAVDPMGEYGEMAMTMPEVHARGVRYIAVRGVFPFGKQVDSIVAAKHNPTLRDRRSLVDIANFEIQRQKAQPGPDPWNEEKNPWQTPTSP
jgi:hypothetical protein